MGSNVRCPGCNGEFIYNEENGSTFVCPSCGRATDLLRAKRYYVAFKENAEKKELRGASYFKYEDLLSIGAHHIEKGDFAKAEEAYKRAIELNPGDYRGYMGMVSVCTKNYADLADESHKEWFKKALDVADEQQQKTVSETYRAFFVKASMTDEEYAVYLEEKQKDLKARVKKAIVGFARYNEDEGKKRKKAVIALSCLGPIGLILCVLGGFLHPLLIVFGVLALGACYPPALQIVNIRFNNRACGFLTALFNGLKDFALGDDETDAVLKAMSDIIISLRDKNPHAVTENRISALADYASDHKLDKLLAFLKNQDMTAKLFK